MTDNITLPRATVQQALEALEEIIWSKDSFLQLDAITAIRTALEQQAEPVHGDIRALKYRIHELEGEVMGYKRMLDVAEAASQRKPLTDEEIKELWVVYRAALPRYLCFARAVEAATVSRSSHDL